jgi:predicted GNAT family N-acyltransferase
LETVIEQISPATTWFLRHQVLWPDKPYEFVQLPEDNQGYHWGLYANHQLVSVVSLFLDGNEARFRKFATAINQQGKGYGSALLKQVFIEAKQLGATSIWCDARQSATAFYQKFGMETSGNPFLKEDVAYIKMSVQL